MMLFSFCLLLSSFHISIQTGAKVRHSARSLFQREVDSCFSAPFFFHHFVFQAGKQTHTRAHILTLLVSVFEAFFKLAIRGWTLGRQCQGLLLDCVFAEQ